MAEPAAVRRCPRIRATYRLQLSNAFDLNAARAIVPYLARLGVSHLYLSPIYRASPGSTHGYDVLDHNQVNPELGGLGALHALAEEAQAAGLGLLLDFVPNHVGVANGENPWWADVLQFGQQSPYAAYFDIDWDAQPQMPSGVLIYPVLGGPFGQVLEAGEIRMALHDGRLCVEYYDHHLPVRPETYQRVIGVPPVALGAQTIDPASVPELVDTLDSLATADRRHALVLLDRLRDLLEAEPVLRSFVEERVAQLNGDPANPASLDQLEAVLLAQHYRLSFWQTAGEEINYRRFFDINGLAAIRVERQDVFDEVHRLLLELVGSGVACGVRLDHIDGLYDPAGYLARLRERIEERGRHDFPLYVEKILAQHEPLPAVWPVEGTTGYEFIAAVDRLFVDPAAEAPLTDLYDQLTGNRSRYRTMVYEAKREITGEAFAGEIRVLAIQLHRLARSRRLTRDITLRSLERAIRGVLSCFPVYRTYTGAAGNGDDGPIRRAVEEAVARDPRITGPAIGFLAEVLTLHSEGASEEEMARRLHFRRRFQQISGPVMAKSFEDTVFYRYNRLIALNEVGGEPDLFALSPRDVHAFFSDRAERWPRALSAGSTHDTKLSEDARARILALSEMSGRWRTEVRAWWRLNGRWRAQRGMEPVPAPNAEYRLYQMLVASWPGLDQLDDDYRARMRTSFEKALREAKEHTSWDRQDAEYEALCLAFLEAILDPRRSRPFLSRLDGLVQFLAPAAERISLAALGLRILAPGVPDIYQGTEFPAHTLMDPDNRRPVDFDVRQQLLGRTCGLAGAGSSPEERKLWLLHRLLGLRARRAHLFEAGRYLPLEAEGPRAAHVFAFARESEGEWAVCAVQRLTARFANDVGHVPPEFWEDTVLRLPVAGPWCDELRAISLPGPVVPLRALFADAPVAVLSREAGE